MGGGVQIAWAVDRGGPGPGDDGGAGATACGPGVRPLIESVDQAALLRVPQNSPVIAELGQSLGEFLHLRDRARQWEEGRVLVIVINDCQEAAPDVRAAAVLRSGRYGPVAHASPSRMSVRALTALSGSSPAACKDTVYAPGPRSTKAPS